MFTNILLPGLEGARKAVEVAGELADRTPVTDGIDAFHAQFPNRV